MFHLMMHSTHFIYSYLASDIWQMTNQIWIVKPTTSTNDTLSNWWQGFFYMYHPTDRITHTMDFAAPVVELERERARWVLHDRPIR